MAAKGFSSGHVTAHVDASGLPDAPQATVTADGTLLNAPLSLALNGDRTDGTVHATIDRLTWKSLQAGGAVTLAPGAILPTGTLRLTMTRLADLEPLIGKPIAGNAAITLDSDEKAAKATATLSGLSVPGTASASKVILNGTVTDPVNNPTVDADADRRRRHSRLGPGRLRARYRAGSAASIAVTVGANAASAAGAPAN